MAVPLLFHFIDFHFARTCARQPSLLSHCAHGSAALFGVGWGLTGLCPGPMLVGLAGGNGTFLLAFLSMIGGSQLFRLLHHRLYRQAAATAVKTAATVGGAAVASTATAAGATAAVTSAAGKVASRAAAGRK